MDYYKKYLKYKNKYLELKYQIGGVRKVMRPAPLTEILEAKVETPAEAETRKKIKNLESTLYNKLNHFMTRLIL